MGFIKRQYGLAWSYFWHRLLKLFLTCAIAFVAIVLIGSIFLSGRADIVLGQLAQIQEIFEAKGLFEPKTKLEMMGFLLSNNLRAVTMSVLFGIIPFLFLPGLSLVLNAAIISVVGVVVVGQGSLGLLLVSLLPHGIFEIPALILAMTLGLNLCIGLTKKILRRGKEYTIGELFVENARALVLLVFPLILLAAPIEAFVTPALIGLFL